MPKIIRKRHRINFKKNTYVQFPIDRHLNFPDNLTENRVTNLRCKKSCKSDSSKWM